MFSSLDRVDLVLTTDSGAKILAQTDHRSPEEVSATPEAAAISAVFAVARIANARRTAESPRDRVAYFARCEPPPGLKNVIALLGAELWIDKKPAPLPEATGDIETLLSENLAALAAHTRERHGRAGFDLPSLDALEDALRDAVALRDTGSPASEAQRWAEVVSLGAFVGAVIAKLTPTRWKLAEKSGTVPIVLHAALPSGDARLDAMNRAEKCLAGGAERMSGLVTAVQKHVSGRS